MPRKKPAGWPAYMTGAVLATGVTAYYWGPPSWARKQNCPMQSEALGTEYATAKQRCDELLNPQFRAWRTGKEVRELVAVGTFDWLVSVYKSNPKYTGMPVKTRKSYDAALALVAKHKLKDGRHFGSLSLVSIKEGVADRLHEKLKEKPGGGTRDRTALLAMQVCRRAWNVARRDKAGQIPAVNPFRRMDIAYTAKPTRPMRLDELMKFVNKAEELGDNSIGLAALIAYFWLQRQVDILSRLSWNQYRPSNNPNIARVWHYKTKTLVDLPLHDDDGTELWPEIMSRLDAAERHGTLIVTRDKPDRRRKIHLPWDEHYFRHRVSEIREAAGIDPEVKFMGARHGGNVEGAEADLTDAQLRALSGHKTTAALLRYAQTTEKQRRAGARKRLDARTKKGALSE